MTHRILYFQGFLLLIACAFHLYGEQEKPLDKDEEVLYKKIKRLEPLQKHLPPAKPGDWLYSHPEQGQTFAKYLNDNPVIPTAERPFLYIQPIGDFSKTQQKMIELSAKFMELYFEIPVKIAENMPLSVIPPKAQRQKFNTTQLLSPYILDRLLYPRLPQDAAAYIAFTASDLWPGEGWNFVFGQASLIHRVGVWSIARYGDPEKSVAHFRKFLSRTLKTATHETGHMFSMNHCIAWECNLNGSNSLEESDQKPIWLCLECVTKVCWARKVDPIIRFQKLASFCQEQGLQEEMTYYLKAIELLKK